MDDLPLIVDLHKEGRRQGPGGDVETDLAITLARLGQYQRLQIADLGCGTGAAALRLAQCLDAEITAIDFVPEFLDVLNERATQIGVGDRISTLACSLDALPFSAGQLDVIWSEGAIYNLGFERGVAEWRLYLKPGGVLAVSEITWITGSRPAEIEEYWLSEYPEIAVASHKIQVLEEHGYAPVGYFVLPKECWLEQYYRPLQARFEAFLNRHGHRPAAQAIVAAEEREIELYERYQEFYSYGMYIARKR